MTNKEDLVLLERLRFHDSIIIDPFSTRLLFPLRTRDSSYICKWNGIISFVSPDALKTPNHRNCVIRHLQLFFQSLAQPQHFFHPLFKKCQSYGCVTGLLCISPRFSLHPWTAAAVPSWYESIYIIHQRDDRLLGGEKLRRFPQIGKKKRPCCVCVRIGHLSRTPPPGVCRRKGNSHRFVLYFYTRKMCVNTQS